MILIAHPHELRPGAARVLRWDHVELGNDSCTSDRQRTRMRVHGAAGRVRPSTYSDAEDQGVPVDPDAEAATCRAASGTSRQRKDS